MQTKQYTLPGYSRKSTNVTYIRGEQNKMWHKTYPSFFLFKRIKLQYLSVLSHGRYQKPYK